MHTITRISAIVATLACASALAAPPTKPAVTFDVYSSTAAELFWGLSFDPDGNNGSGGFAHDYEILRDGELVTTLDGQSYFTESLVDGVAASFTVTAIDVDGERSESTVVRVVGGDFASSAHNASNKPSPPTGLRAEVYSPSAIEVFWDRNSAELIQYDVTIDGVPVTMTSGTSYFTDSLQPGRNYVIDLVAINARGQRSEVASVEATTNGGFGPISSTLTAPDNLRVAVYSATAAELFWDRANAPGLQYEIFRDGASIATHDGTSYYDSSLQGGRDYTYSVVAIDPTGNRSSSALIALRTTTPDNTPSEMLPDTTPMYPETPGTPAPKNITLAVYSDSTAELNWTRPFYSDGIQTNEIFRDGVLIATIPGGGNSYVDGTRTSGNGYRYEIVAINISGRASSVFIDVGAVGGPIGEGEIIDQAGLPVELSAKLDTTFNLLNVAPFKKLAATLFRLDDPVARGLQQVGSEPDRFVEGSDRVEYACPQGGSWFDTVWSNNTSHNIIAEECVIGPITLTGRGQLSTELLDDGETLRRFALFSRVILLDSRDNSRIEFDYSYSGFDVNTNSGFVRGDGVKVMRTGGNYEFTTLSLAVTTGDPAAITLAAEGVTGALAGSARLRSREALLAGDNGFPASGAVSIIQLGTNNESYDIAAGNGNPNTFTFTATNAGVTTAYEVDWTATRNIGDMDLSTVDVGF